MFRRHVSRIRFIPGRPLLWLMAAATLLASALLLAGIALRSVITGALAFAAALLLACLVDLALTYRAWRQSQVRMQRRLPSAFAIGVRQLVYLGFESEGTRPLRCQVFDHADPGLRVTGLPAACELLPRKRFEVAYEVTPARRGELVFAPADLRVRTLLGLAELVVRVGDTETRRSYPDFA